jgi:hypothetical protein
MHEVENIRDHVCSLVPLTNRRCGRCYNHVYSVVYWRRLQADVRVYHWVEKKNRSLGFKDYHYHRRPPHAVSLNINMKQYHLETLEHCTYYKITCYWTSLKFKNNYFQTRIRFFFLQYNTSYDLHFFKHNYAQDARYD